MASSESQKKQAIEKYIHVFAKAAKKLNSKGDLYLSSCSTDVRIIIT